MKFLIATSAGLVALVLASAASSHHAVNAQFDVAGPEGTFSGTLSQISNVQPHSYWYFMVQKPNGLPVKWSLEGPSPGNLRRSGLNVKLGIKVGSTYKVYYNVARDGSSTGYIKAIDVDGKRLSLTGE